MLGSGRTFAYQPEEGNINLTAGPITYRTLFKSPEPDLGSPNQGGYAFVANGDSSSQGSIELGIYYLDKIFFRDEGPDVLAQTMEMIHITMGYRWWLRPWISTSLSFYSAYPLSDPKDYYRRVTPGTYFDTSAMDLTEYGFDFGVQLEVLGTQEFGVVFEPRYSWNVTSKAHESADHFGFMIGLRFMVQEKKTQAEYIRERSERRLLKQAPPPTENKALPEP